MSAIIAEGVANYHPRKVLLLFSGGHDSLCSTHYAANYLDAMGLEFCIYHGNTGIGIEETREFVRSICRQFQWHLVEGRPRVCETYEDLVRKYGFPGPASQGKRVTDYRNSAIRK